MKQIVKLKNRKKYNKLFNVFDKHLLKLFLKGKPNKIVSHIVKIVEIFIT